MILNKEVNDAKRLQFIGGYLVGGCKIKTLHTAFVQIYQHSHYNHC